MRPEHAADGRAEHEAEAECDADHAEALRPRFSGGVTSAM